MWHNRTECYQSVSSMFCSHQLSNSSLSCGIVMRRPAAMPTTQRCICTIKSEYNKKFQDDISTRVIYMEVLPCNKHLTRNISKDIHSGNGRLSSLVKFDLLAVADSLASHWLCHASVEARIPMWGRVSL